MRLTILNQFFYPDHSATSQLMTELAQNLCEHGVEVTALASRSRYNGGCRMAPKETYKGVRIERAWATCFGKKSILGRLSDYLTFYVAACWKLFTLPRQDVIMALTTPPLIGLIALIVGRIRGVRFVALMEDLYPDVAVALGAISSGGMLVRIMDWLTCFMLNHADRIIVLSDCMYDRVIAKIGSQAASRIDIIHNWADGNEIAPLEKNGYFAAHEWHDKLVVLFSGNLGLVNEFVTVLDAAKQLCADPNVAFVFVGEGARANEIRNFVSQHHLKNVHMLPYQPRESLARCLASSDVLLVTLADGLAGLSMPSKTYSSLAAGRPILFVGDQNSSVANLIHQFQCGATLASGQSTALAETLSSWGANRAKLISLGASSRSLFEKQFDRPVAVRRYLESLRKCFTDPDYAAEASFPDSMPINTVDAEKIIL